MALLHHTVLLAVMICSDSFPLAAKARASVPLVQAVGLQAAQASRSSVFFFLLAVTWAAVAPACAVAVMGCPKDR